MNNKLQKISFYILIWASHKDIEYTIRCILVEQTYIDIYIYNKESLLREERTLIHYIYIVGIKSRLLIYIYIIL